jgi:hypothetical protein
MLKGNPDVRPVFMPVCMSLSIISLLTVIEGELHRNKNELTVLLLDVSSILQFPSPTGGSGSPSQ